MLMRIVEKLRAWMSGRSSSKANSSDSTTASTSTGGDTEDLWEQLERLREHSDRVKLNPEQYAKLLDVDRDA